MYFGKLHGASPHEVKVWFSSLNYLRWISYLSPWGKILCYEPWMGEWWRQDYCKAWV